MPLSFVLSMARGNALYPDFVIFEFETVQVIEMR